jgi:hypothetical protein
VIVDDMEGGNAQSERREPGYAFLFRDIRYGETHHPALACGFWMVFACMLFITVTAFYDFIPQSLERTVIIIWTSVMVLGGVFAFYGMFKSNDRGSYPCWIAIVLTAGVLVAVWSIMH